MQHDASADEVPREPKLAIAQQTFERLLDCVLQCSSAPTGTCTQQSCLNLASRSSKAALPMMPHSRDGMQRHALVMPQQSTLQHLCGSTTYANDWVEYSSSIRHGATAAQLRATVGEPECARATSNIGTSICRGFGCTKTRVDLSLCLRSQPRAEQSAGEHCNRAGVLVQ